MFVDTYHYTCIVHSHRSLQILLLMGNRFGEKGVSSLLKALKTNSTLTQLTLYPPTSPSTHHQQTFSALDVLLAKNRELDKCRAKIRDLEKENVELKAKLHQSTQHS